MGNPFQKIDNEICTFVKDIKDLAKELEFQQICEFYPGESLDKKYWDLLSYPGVYLIEIKNDGGFDHINLWMENFKTEWEKPEYIYKYVPNLKKKRIERHIELKEWIPIYIGKSKWVGSRIKEHLYLDLERHTFALKLSSRVNFKASRFRISIIPINVINYDSIVPIIEKTLRDKLNPIIGRQ